MRLYEEVVLLALRDDKGTPVRGAWLEQAVAGAILAELLLEGHLQITTSRKKDYIELSGSPHTDDPLMEEVLQKIDSAKRRASPQTWVARVARTRRLKHRAVEGLCRSGTLRADEDKILFLFTHTTYPELDPEPERQLIERLHAAVFTDASDLDPRTVVLLALAHGTGVLAGNFDRRELKGHKRRIESVVRGDAMGDATRQAVAAVHAAIVVTTILPVITAAASN